MRPAGSRSIFLLLAQRREVFRGRCASVVTLVVSAVLMLLALAALPGAASAALLAGPDLQPVTPALGRGHARTEGATFTITPSVVGTPAHGTIAPGTAQTVSVGATPAFTFAPDSGYRVKAVRVDGVFMEMTGTNAYTFPPVATDHTISVEFAPVPDPLAVLAIQQAELTGSDGAYGDYFGRAVALSGDTALVGAMGKYVGANPAQGAAYVYTRSGTTWTQQQELTAGDGTYNDAFGASVALSGDTALVGAFSKKVGSNSFQGAAYVFVRSGTTWT